MARIDVVRVRQDVQAVEASVGDHARHGPAAPVEADGLADGVLSGPGRLGEAPADDGLAGARARLSAGRRPEVAAPVTVSGPLGKPLPPDDGNAHGGEIVG